MKSNKINQSQLREMIKESLEESIVEIKLDEQIEALKAKGSRRSLQETKRYHKLLEVKLEMMNEGLGDLFSAAKEKVGSALGFGGSSSGDSSEKPGILKGAALKLAGKLGPEGTLGRLTTQTAKLPIVQRVEFLRQLAKQMDINSAGLSKLMNAIRGDIKDADAERLAAGGQDRGK